MEDIKNKLTQNETTFFNNLSIYIDKEYYFYGSIKRVDYVKGNSDIDVDIFTDNETSTIQQLCTFLNVQRGEFLKILYKINNKIIYGYKIKYINEPKDLNIELSVYNDKYKNIIMYDHNTYSDLSLYVTVLLLILKFLYYRLGIFPKETYLKLKKILINPSNDLRFISLDI